MKKHIKTISMIISLCILFSALASISAFASEQLEVLGWNADGDFITVDFSHDIDIKTFKDDLVVTADGERTPCDVRYSLHSAMDSAELTSRNTYIITPQGGMKLNAIYELKIATVNAENNEILPLESFTKKFIVRELDGIKEEQSHMAVGSGTATPWRIIKNKLNEVTNPEETPDTIRLKWVKNWTPESSNSAIILGRRVFVPETKKYAFFLGSTADEMLRNLNDYTVKATYKIVNNTLGEASEAPGLIRVGIAAYTSISKTAEFKLYYLDPSIVYTALVFNSDGTQNIELFDNNSGFSLVKMAKEGTDFVVSPVGSNIEIKLASNNRHFTSFLNGEKVADCTIEPIAHYNGSPMLITRAVNALDSVVEISDFRLTYVEEVHEITVSEAEYDGKEASVTVSSTADVSTDVLAVCALYTEDGKLSKMLPAKPISIKAGEKDVKITFDVNKEENISHTGIFIMSKDSLKIYGERTLKFK